MTSSGLFTLGRAGCFRGPVWGLVVAGDLGPRKYDTQREVCFLRGNPFSENLGRHHLPSVRIAINPSGTSGGARFRPPWKNVLALALLLLCLLTWVLILNRETSRRADSTPTGEMQGSGVRELLDEPILLPPSSEGQMRWLIVKTSFAPWAQTSDSPRELCRFSLGPHGPGLYLFEQD
jgi:hypothetical protein